MQHNVSFLHRNTVPPRVISCKNAFPEQLEDLASKLAARRRMLPELPGWICWPVSAGSALAPAIAPPCHSQNCLRPQPRPGLIQQLAPSSGRSIAHTCTSPDSPLNHAWKAAS